MVPTAREPSVKPLLLKIGEFCILLHATFMLVFVWHYSKFLTIEQNWCSMKKLPTDPTGLSTPLTPWVDGGKESVWVPQFEKHSDQGRPKHSQMEAPGLGQLSSKEGIWKSMPRGGPGLHGCSVPGFHPSHQTLTLDTGCGHWDIWHLSRRKGSNMD